MSRSRLLWVTAEAPDFSLGGGSIRQAHLISGAARHFDVDLLLAGRVSDPRVRRSVGSLTEVTAAPRTVPSSRAARRVSDVWRVAGARVPAEVYDRRTERASLGTALRAMGDALGGYDVVHVEHLGLWGVVPRGMARVVALDVQNVPSRMAEQAAALAPGTRQRLLLKGEAAAARRVERSAASEVDVLSVVSPGDGDALIGSPAARPVVLVVPNGVDVDRFSPEPVPEEPRVVFTGTLDFAPNEDGIRWFADEVLPRVRDRVPAVVLSIVGRRPTPLVQALARRPGIELHADVPDVRPFLASARVVVVPVRIGTGSRLKVLEAMAAGRPVVSTTIGLEGIDAVPGRHALIGDGPEGMADGVERMCRVRREAEELARAGRALVDERYGWAPIADAFGRGLAQAASA